jgi:hypothetical protein
MITALLMFVGVVLLFAGTTIAVIGFIATLGSIEEEEEKL